MINGGGGDGDDGCRGEIGEGDKTAAVGSSVGLTKLKAGNVAERRDLASARRD